MAAVFVFKSKYYVFEAHENSSQHKNIRISGKKYRNGKSFWKSENDRQKYDRSNHGLTRTEVDSGRGRGRGGGGGGGFFFFFFSKFCFDFRDC